jgi:hypothetical protein
MRHVTMQTSLRHATRQIQLRSYCNIAPQNKTTRSAFAPKPASDRELWVSYTDPATLRRRLVGLAQQVRASIEEEPLPTIVMPDEKRVRHGFWFLRFKNLHLLGGAMRELQGQTFSSNCGSIQGVLQLDEGSKALDLRAMLNVPILKPDPIEQWLRARFAVHGTIDEVRLPRLGNNWDGGLAFVRFQHSEDAEAALEALDGTPSPVTGCNMHIDYALARPLMELRDGNLPGMSPPS